MQGMLQIHRVWQTSGCGHVPSGYFKSGTCPPNVRCSLYNQRIPHRKAFPKCSGSCNPVKNSWCIFRLSDRTNRPALKRDAGHYRHPLLISDSVMLSFLNLVLFLFLHLYLYLFLFLFPFLYLNLLPVLLLALSVFPLSRQALAPFLPVCLFLQSE